MNKTTKTPSKLLAYTLVIGISVTILAIINIILASHVATAGEQIKALNQEAQTLRERNQQLESDLLVQGSLKGLTVKAQELGFTLKPHVVSLSPDISVAFKP